MKTRLNILPVGLLLAAITMVHAAQKNGFDLAGALVLLYDRQGQVAMVATVVAGGQRSDEGCTPGYQRRVAYDLAVPVPCLTPAARRFPA
ncbi:MAG TPA: hypothetical protein VJ577_07130 [Burkholderiaceae bacterium]|nr:hypothetical protein [Burkholderiaceae bacterium]